MTFSQLLTDAVCTKKTPVLVGLDPRFELLPSDFTDGVDGTDTARVAALYKRFCCGVIDIVAPLVPAVKPQVAFFEQCGPFGMIALDNVIRYAREQGLLVIFDGKRNDIGTTAQAYAEGILGAQSAWGADALTVSPYLGDDSLTPFVETAMARDAGIFVLVKTSNPGGAMIQDLKSGRKPIYRHVANHVQQLAASTLAENERYGSVGAVVGATWPEELAELRKTLKSAWLLVPGYGSQGGSAQDVAPAFDSKGLGAIVNNSRGILFSYRKEPYLSRFGDKNWEQAVQAATQDMIDQLRAETNAGKLK